MQNYVQVSIQARQKQVQVIIALLADAGYEGFAEEEKYLQAFIPENAFDEAVLKKTLQTISPLPLYTLSVIEPQNWNKKWEESYEPIEVTPELFIKGPFHQSKKDYKYELVIQPKMSFGTGHHSTTCGMMQLMLELDLKGKHVLDFGTGTGILAILAAKLGAASVLAIDVDDNASGNVQENLQLNNTHNVYFAQSDIHVTEKAKYDVILGNINKHIIIQSLPAITERLQQNGLFLASGFYCKDLPDIALAAKKVNLNLARQYSMNDWVSSLFTFA